MRFALLQDHDDEDDDDDDELNTEQPQTSRKHNLSTPVQSIKPSVEITYPASISVDELLKAGRLIRPKARKLVSFEVEKFNMATRQWEPGMNITAMVDDDKFSSGGFRDAFLAVEKGPSKKKWVVKKYNLNALRIISDTLKTSVENHTRKQVQMNSVAHVIARKFSSKVPEEFGRCFTYNNIYYTQLDGRPATIEEFVEGKFVKHINNNGNCVDLGPDCEIEIKTINEKAQALVHFSYIATDNKMILVDIQGSGYHLYDPEIATKDLYDEDDEEAEIYFCCGNLSSMAIDTFMKNHVCNKYCEMLDLKH